MTKKTEHDDLKDPLLTREEAAKMLGISVSEFRRKQRMGDIRVAKRGDRNQIYFRTSDVSVLHESRNRSRASYTAEEASRVFAALEAGKTPIECIVEHKIQPHAMTDIMGAYAHLKGDIYLSAKDVARINKMPLDGPFPLQDADDVVSAFQMIVESTEKLKCLECARNARQFCKPCVKRATERAVAVATGTAEL